MKTIVFIGSQKAGSSREAIKAANEMGYYTVLLTNKSKQMAQRLEYPDVDEMILCNLDNLFELKQVIESLKERDLIIESIISFVETYVSTACQLAEDFELKHFTGDAIATMKDKVLSRNSLKSTDYIPRYKIINRYESLDLEEIKSLLPFVLKSPNSTGSRDVYLVKTLDEFIALISSSEESQLLIEEFLIGPQYLVETIVENEEVHLIAVIEQEIVYQNNHFLVTGYNLVLHPNPHVYRGFVKAVNEIIKCHGLKNGPCHLEMRLVKGDWKLIEINPRMSGGSMNEFIELGLGINLAKEILKLSLGEELDVLPKFKRYLFSQHLLAEEEGILTKVSGKNKAKNSNGVKMVYIKPRKGQRISLPISLGSRYAFVIATGLSERDAKLNAKYAASLIKFHVVPE